MPASNLRPFLALGLLAMPGVASAHHLQAYYGTTTLTVRNDTPVSIQAVVDGNTVALPPRQQRTVAVRPGAVSVTTTYRQFGRTYALPYVSRYVTPGENEVVEVEPPSYARILVTNPLGRPGDVELNGRDVATVAAYSSAVVTVPVGFVRLEFDVDGRDVDQAQLTLSAMTEPTWSIEAPSTADLVVNNPLPIPVMVSAGRQPARLVAAQSQARFEDLPLCEGAVVARRTTGEVVAQAQLRLDAMGTSYWRVDAPQTGLVTVDNDAGLPIVVQERGRTLVSLAPDAQQRLALSNGWHELTVVDVYGRTVDDEWIEVKPYEAARFDAGRGHRRPDGYDHHDRHDDGDAVSERDDGAGSWGDDDEDRAAYRR